MEKFGTLDTSEETIAILGDGRWWPQTAKQEGDKISELFQCNLGGKRNQYPNTGGLPIRNRNGALSQKGCVVDDGQMTKASNNR